MSDYRSTCSHQGCFKVVGYSSTGSLFCPEHNGVAYQMERSLTPPGHVKASGSLLPTEGGLKYDQGKPDLSMISAELKELLSLVRMYGAEKYTVGNKSGRDNWRKGISMNKSAASLQRHLDAFMKGEDYDPESKITHLAGVLASVEHLLWAWMYYPELDDRYKNPRKPVKTLKQSE